MNHPNRVLAAVDFSDRSRTALAFASRLATQFDADLHVMHAQDPLLVAAAAQRGLDLVRETEAELRAFAGSAVRRAQGRLHIDVIVGRPATAIVNAAERERADVIVIAAHGMSAAEHALLGSTAEGVLRRSNVPVLVVPDGWSPADPSSSDLRREGPVVAAVDFRIPSLDAAASAAELARALETELLLLHVVPAVRVLPRWREHADAALAQRAGEAEQELNRLRDTFGDRVAVRTLVARGRVAESVAEAAKPYPHGIVAVGRTVHPHGYAAPGRTAYRLLTELALPVLMHVAR